MTPTDAQRSIEQMFSTAWGTTTPVRWPNVPFTPPATGEWAKVDFIWGTGERLTKNATDLDGADTVTGLVQVAIFGPKDTGDGELVALSETVRDLFNRAAVDSTQLLRPGNTRFGSPSGPVALFEESWRSIVISVPFTVTDWPAVYWSLQLIQDATTVQVNQIITPPIVVQVLRNGVAAIVANDIFVVLTLAPDEFANMGGTRTVTSDPLTGIAEFTDLTCDAVGTWQIAVVNQTQPLSVTAFGQEFEVTP